MAIPLYLQQFKAAGIYRVVFDKSTVLNQDSQMIRLVVGYSEKGPFNIPVYVKDTAEFIARFGNISKKLEKRGIFFHRLALQMLKVSPILCLNLKKFAGETVDGATINSAFNPKYDAIETVKLNVEDIYNTTRFWELDAEKLDGLKSVSGMKMDQYINLAVTGVKSQSVTYFIRKASGANVSSYKITVNDWYSNEPDDMPEFLEGHEGDLMSDYMAEIYVFKGEFTPKQVLGSTTLKNYFNVEGEGDDQILKLKPYILDSFGDPRDTLEVLYADSTSNALGHYVGSLIPRLKDKQGSYISLDTIFNSDQEVHNMMMSFNEDLLEEGSVTINLAGRDKITTDEDASKAKSKGGLVSLNDIFAGVATTQLLGNKDAAVIADKLQFTLNVIDSAGHPKADFSINVPKDNNVSINGLYYVDNAIVVGAEGEETVKVSLKPYTGSIEDEEEFEKIFGIHGKFAAIHNHPDTANEYDFAEALYDGFKIEAPLEFTKEGYIKILSKLGQKCTLTEDRQILGVKEYTEVYPTDEEGEVTLEGPSKFISSIRRLELKPEMFVYGDHEVKIVEDAFDPKKISTNEVLAKLSKYVIDNQKITKKITSENKLIKEPTLKIKEKYLDPKKVKKVKSESPETPETKSTYDTAHDNFVSSVMSFTKIEKVTTGEGENKTVTYKGDNTVISLDNLLNCGKVQKNSENVDILVESCQIKIKETIENYLDKVIEWNSAKTYKVKTVSNMPLFVANPAVDTAIKAAKATDDYKNATTNDKKKAIIAEAIKAIVPIIINPELAELAKASTADTFIDSSDFAEVSITDTKDAKTGAITSYTVSGTYKVHHMDYNGVVLTDNDNNAIVSFTDVEIETIASPCNIEETYNNSVYGSSVSFIDLQPGGVQNWNYETDYKIKGVPTPAMICDIESDTSLQAILHEGDYLLANDGTLDMNKDGVIDKKDKDTFYDVVTVQEMGTEYWQEDDERPAGVEVGEFKFHYIIFTGEPLTYEHNWFVRVDQPLNQEIGTMYPQYLEGYTFINDKPLGTGMYNKYKWHEQIMSALTDYKGLRTGLLNKSEIDYRYVIDTFESYPCNDLKSVLSYLCKEKQSAFCISNFPSVQTFVKCPYTSFVDAKGNFNVEYVVAGYNKKKTAAMRFTLPSDYDGASFIAFYSPLKFSDGYIDTIVPSAGLVSNLFVEKYMSRQPYYIVAGPNYGAINDSNLVGPDYRYSTEELQIIEPFGVNVMVYRPNFGTFINANQTAKQTPVSALSKVHVRELVIYLQDEIEKVLQSYQWEFNNARTRNAILDKANTICELVMANGGLQAYKNIMDESNNTPEIIDNEMAILSTHIEPGMGCGKMVQELTLYRTGKMAAALSEA